METVRIEVDEKHWKNKLCCAKKSSDKIFKNNAFFRNASFHECSNLKWMDGKIVPMIIFESLQNL